jgi:hypothetical protein
LLLDTFHKHPNHPKSPQLLFFQHNRQVAVGSTQGLEDNGFVLPAIGILALGALVLLDRVAGTVVRVLNAATLYQYDLPIAVSIFGL